MSQTYGPAETPPTGWDETRVVWDKVAEVCELASFKKIVNGHRKFNHLLILRLSILADLMHYVIHAYDYTDPGTLDRRMAVRPLHFAGAHRLKSDGHFVIGGALLNPDGQMIGSMMVLDFATDEQFRTWYDNEPYIQGRVWERIDVKPFLKADL